MRFCIRLRCILFCRTAFRRTWFYGSPFRIFRFFLLLHHFFAGGRNILLHLRQDRRLLHFVPDRAARQEEDEQEKRPPTQEIFAPQCARELLDGSIARCRIDGLRTAQHAPNSAAFTIFQQLFKGHAERVDVASPIRLTVAILLGRRIADRAKMARIGRSVFAHEPRGIEVDETQAPALEQDVRRLDVPVHDARAMECGKPL